MNVDTMICLAFMFLVAILFRDVIWYTVPRGFRWVDNRLWNKPGPLRRCKDCPCWVALGPDIDDFGECQLMPPQDRGNGEQSCLEGWEYPVTKDWQWCYIGQKLSKSWRDEQ